MPCIKCGGTMVGDGYTSVMHCEYADESAYEFHEPDASPVYCDYTDEDIKQETEKERVA